MCQEVGLECRCCGRHATEYALLYHVLVQLWLFGYELTDTLCVFCEREVHILTSKKKVDFLQPVLPLLEVEPDMPTVQMHLRTKVRRNGHYVTTTMFTLVCSH